MTQGQYGLFNQDNGGLVVSEDAVRDERIAQIQLMLAQINSKMDRVFARQDEHTEKLVQHQTLLIGIDGKNGLRGQIADLRQEVNHAEDDFDCKMREMYKKIKEDASQHRAMLRNSIIATGVIVGIITNVIRWFI